MIIFSTNFKDFFFFLHVTYNLTQSLDILFVLLQQANKTKHLLYCFILYYLMNNSILINNLWITSLSQKYEKHLKSLQCLTQLEGTISNVTVRSRTCRPISLCNRENIKQIGFEKKKIAKVVSFLVIASDDQGGLDFDHYGSRQLLGESVALEGKKML